MEMEAGKAVLLVVLEVLPVPEKSAVKTALGPALGVVAVGIFGAAL